MKNIILIEDEDLLVDLLSAMLRSMNCNTNLYELATSALNDIKNNKVSPDLVMTDLRLTGMNGEEFSRELFKIRPEIPVVIISGLLWKIDTSGTNIVGMLNKPLYMASLQEIIDGIGVKY